MNKFRCLLSMQLAVSVDPMGLVNTLLSSLTKQTDAASSSAAAAGTNQVDTEALAQQVQALKQAQDERDRAAAEAQANAAAAAAKDAESAVEVSNQSEELLTKQVNDFGVELGEMTLQLQKVEDLVHKFNDTMTIRAAANDSASPAGTTAAPKEEGFVIKIRMPTNTTSATTQNTTAIHEALLKHETNVDIESASTMDLERTHPDLVSVPLKILDSINPLDVIELKQLKRRIKEDQLKRVNSRASVSLSKDFERSLKEQILRADAMATAMESRQKLFEEIAEAQKETLKVNGQSHLAQKVEADSKSVIKLMNEVLGGAAA